MKAENIAEIYLDGIRISYIPVNPNRNFYQSINDFYTAGPKTVLEIALIENNSVVEALDLLTDIILANQIYWEGMKPKNKDKDSFKIVFLIIVIAIASCFLIAYSSIVSMLLYNGDYEPSKKQKPVKLFFRLLFLTFVGPFYFIVIEFIHKIMDLCSFFGLLCGKNGHRDVKLFFLARIKGMFGLNEE